MNKESELNERYVSYKGKIVLITIALLPFLFLIFLVITNILFLVQKQWEYRSYSIALFAPFTLAVIIQVTYLFYIKNLKKGSQSILPRMIPILNSLISAILLIVEYQIYNNWYRKTPFVPNRIYSSYGVSYTLNVIVLVIFLATILFLIFYLLRQKKNIKRGCEKT